MLTIATYWWKPESSKYHTYSGDDVRMLERMISRHMTAPYEFAVITDQPDVFEHDKNIRAIDLDTTTRVPNTCYARLMTFHPDGQKLFGEHILQIDLDTIITGDMAHLVDRDEDLVMWHNPGRVPWDKPVGKGKLRPYYNTSILLHRCATMPWLYQEFNPVHPGFKDDQWYLSDKLGPDIPYWNGDDGVYRLARADTPGSGVDGWLPEMACVVTFPGSNGKYWDEEITKKNPWIAQYRRW